MPSYSQVKQALMDARAEANGGFNLDMWATIVNRDAMELIPFEIANKAKVLPLYLFDTLLTVAMADPQNVAALVSSVDLLILTVKDL